MMAWPDGTSREKQAGPPANLFAAATMIRLRRRVFFSSPHPAWWQTGSGMWPATEDFFIKVFI
jgi:hypothetical protein